MSDDGIDEPPATGQPLVEQYKVYVNRSNDVSNRRLKTNQFYVSLLSGGIAAIGLLVKPDELTAIQYIGLMIVGIVGVALCVTWFFNVWSYKQLNQGKYQVIHDMEEKLPHACYTDEWNILKHGDANRTYLEHWKVERAVPVVLAIPYLALAIYAGWMLLN
jgi:hypothetical protein